jgi:hypothetical protein
MFFEALARAIDEMAAVDPGDLVLGDGEAMVELHRLKARLDAALCSRSAAFEGSGTWELDGARSAPAWLSTRCRIPIGEARRELRLGRAVRQRPLLGAAWASGELTGAHVGAIAGLERAATSEALARDEEVLVDQATSLSFSQFMRALSYWEQMADPDGTEEKAEARRARRDVSLHQSFDGLWFGKMLLDPIAGEIVSSELTRIEKELFDIDRAEAAARLGRAPLVIELTRSAAQRRADALVEMATRSASMPPGSRRPAPLISVLVDYETLHGRICQLASGAVVSPGSLLPYLDEALIERAVFVSRRRAEVSRKARLFTGATRRGVELRDRGCVHPFCEEPLSRCQVDHIQPYSENGPTVQENGRCLCGRHNRLAAKKATKQPPPRRPPPTPRR